MTMSNPTLSTKLEHVGATVAAVDWRLVVAVSSVSALLGGVLVLLGGRIGPYDERSSGLSLQAVREAFGSPAVRLANLGYLGHM